MLSMSVHGHGFSWAVDQSMNPNNSLDRHFLLLWPGDFRVYKLHIDYVMLLKASDVPV